MRRARKLTIETLAFAADMHPTYLSGIERERAVEDRIEARLTEHHAVFDPSVLHAVALEQTAGEVSPDTALAVSREMVRDRRVIPLEGGRMTTLAVRAQEQAIERRTATLARPVGRDVGEVARESATREVTERIGAPLNHEQQQALRTITGPERLSVLVGPAGTGKGVVIDTAARAEQFAGRDIVGIAVSGSTAEQLGTDSPALAERTLTLDALVARANTGTIRVGPDTTIFLDVAGMIDHERLDALTKLVERSERSLPPSVTASSPPRSDPAACSTASPPTPPPQNSRTSTAPSTRRAESMARTAQRRT